MSVLGFIRRFFALLATRLNMNAGNRSSFFAPIHMCLVTISFLFQRSILLKTKMKHFLKRSLENCGSYTRKEKCEPSFNIFKSVFMNGMSYRYREWANPVAYFCTETSRSGSKATDESESNSDEGSSHDENEDSVENRTKVKEIGTDDYVTCISSSKAVIESLPTSQITQKRKAETEKSENSKRSKSADSLKVGKVSKQIEINSDITIDTSSETNSCYNNKEISSVSDLQFTSPSAHVLGVSSKSDQIDDLYEIADESPSIEQSENLVHPSPVSSSSSDKKPSVEDLLRKNSKDKSVKSSGREKFSYRDSTLKNTVSVCATKRRASKSVQTENTKKSYPNPKKTWRTRMQDKPCNTPSDPLIKEKNTSESKSHLGPSRSRQENITKDSTLTRQKMTSHSNTETIDVKNYSNSSTDHFKNELKRPLIFPKTNVFLLLLEQSEQLKNLESQNFVASENIPEVTRQFLKNFRNENKEVNVQTPNENLILECPAFSSEVEVKSESSDSKSTSVEVPELSSNIYPCSSTDESRESKGNVKTYPGLSLQPLKVKKDARYQKKFYKERKEIALPKKLGEVIQWAAKKPRDELTIPTSGVLPTDEKDLPIDEYHEQAQVLTQKFLMMFDSAKEKRARNKLEKKRLKDQKKRMRRENTGCIESSFKEESPSSESSSDSLPTSGDSPNKAPISRSKIPTDCDISMVEVSPLKPIAKVSPRVSPQTEILHQAPPQTEILHQASPQTEILHQAPPQTEILHQAPPQTEILHQTPPKTLNTSPLSDVKNVCEKPSLDSDDSFLSVLIRFIDSREIVNPKRAIFDRDGHLYPSTDITKKKKLKSFFRILSVTPVSCTPISIEEFLVELHRIQQIYYEAYYEENRRVFEEFRDSMTICVIPLRRPEGPDWYDKLYDPDKFPLVRMEHHTDPERNYASFAPASDHISDVDIPEIEIFETVSESRNEVKRDQNVCEPVNTHASNMPQSHEIHARDASARAYRSANWTLCEIELSENKECSGEHFSQNIATPGADIRIESKMEEWTADAHQSLATSATKNEKMCSWQKSPDSSIGTLPILFGYPSLEILSKMKLSNIPQNRQFTVSSSGSFPGSGQSTSPNRRKTKSESSMFSRSNLNLVEQKNPPQETQTTQDVSNLCQKKRTACAREKLSGKQSETENPTCVTETNLKKCTTASKDPELFESNPVTVVSGQQILPQGHGIVAEECVNKGSSSFSSAVAKNIENVRQNCELRSTPEKDNLSASDVLEFSSDSGASEKERAKE